MKAGRRAVVSSLALVAVAAAAIAVAWFGIARQDEVKQARRSSDEKLFAFRTADVTSVTVQAKGEVTRVAREGDGWKLEAPVHAAGERAAVDTLVDRIAELRRKAAVADATGPEAAARYGFAHPRATITLALRDGRTETLTLGDENPFDGTAFVRNTAGAVALVAGDIRWAVERSAFDLREKRLVAFDDKDVQRIEVTTPRLAYAIARDGPQAWRLEAPIRDRADDGTAERILGAIRALRATSFRASTAAEPPAGTHRRWRVTLAVRDRPPARIDLWEVDVGGPAPANPADGSSRRLFARIEGSSETASVPDTATRDLDQEVFALRDKTLLRFDRDAVATLRFERDGTSFEVRRESAPGKLAGYAWTLSSLEAKAFVTGPTPLPAYGLDRPALAVAVLAKDGKELGRLLVSPPRDGRTYAHGSSLTGAVEIDPAALQSLPRTPKDAEEAPPTGTTTTAQTR